MFQSWRTFQLTYFGIVFCFLHGNTYARIRVSEPILSNDIEHDGSNGGDIIVPSGLVGSADVPMTDIPGKPLDPSEFEKAIALAPIHHPEVEYDPILTANLFQGDIVIPNMETLQFINSHSVNKKRPPFKNAITNDYNKWPNAEIPYTISSRFNENERATIARAMDAFHKQTCIRFIPRNGHRDYIYLTGGGGCSSAVGRVGGQQSVTLGNGCVYDGIVMHELMHAAGFWHEQSRADRDNFIAIMWNNIQRGMEYNFEKYEWGFIQNLSVSYDLGSIMHYGPYSFAIDRSKPTIKALNGLKIGQRERLSEKDKHKLNLLYQCGEGGGSVLTTTTTTKAPVVVVGTCQDSNEYCEYWMERGECVKNPEWMHTNCRKSCNKCESEKECKNDNINCEQWKSEGHCVLSEFYMKNYCKKACGLCGNGQICTDKSQYCSYWADRDECSKNSEWMLVNCGKSCKVC